MIGIYKIENLVNHKCYIGQAVDINRRWRKHRETYNEPKFPQYEYPLYRAMRKYGFENFFLKFLRNARVRNLMRERKYILKNTTLSLMVIIRLLVEMVLLIQILS